MFPDFFLPFFEIYLKLVRNEAGQPGSARQYDEDGSIALMVSSESERQRKLFIPNKQEPSWALFYMLTFAFYHLPSNKKSPPPPVERGHPKNRF
jgi:hypothetical protein